MKRFSVLFFLTLFAMLTRAQSYDWKWARSEGGSGAETATSIAADGSGNVYAAGVFSSASFTVGNSTFSNNGVTDVYLSKRDSNGTLIWAQSFGGNGADSVFGIAIDASQNLYVAGSFRSQIINVSGTLLNNAAGEDIFLIKFNPAGILQWARNYGDSGNCRATAISCRPNGTFFITGSFTDSVFALGGVTVLNRAGQANTFTARLDSAGNAQWIAPSTTQSTDNIFSTGTAIAASADGGVYVAGTYTTPGLSFGNFNISNVGSAGTLDMFLIRYDANGMPSWVRGFGSSGNDIPRSLVAEQRGIGRIYLGGSFTSNGISFGNVSLTRQTQDVSADLFLAQLEPTAGNANWAKSAVSLGEDYLRSLAIDDSSYLYAAGTTTGASIDFGNNLFLQNTFAHRAFVLRYNAAGTPLLLRSPSGDAIFHSISVGNKYDVFAGGSIESGSVSFGARTVTPTAPPDFLQGRLGNFPLVTVNTGLVAHWTFNGNGNDVSGNGLNGIVINGNYVKGQNGLNLNALQFDGSSTKVDVPYSTKMDLDSYSICVLLRPTDFYRGACQRNVIVSKGISSLAASSYSNDYYSLNIEDHVFDNDCNVTSIDREYFVSRPHGDQASDDKAWYQNQQAVELNKWYCVVSTYDRDTVRVYVDGALKSSVGFIDNYLTRNNGMGIGYNSAGQASYPDYFKGLIDDMRLYSRSLSLREVNLYCDSVKTAQVSVEETPLPLAQQVGLFPNPAQHTATLTIPAAFTGHTRYELMNMAGQALRSGMLLRQSTLLDLEGISSGVYMLRLNDGKEQAVIRLLKK